MNDKIHVFSEIGKLKTVLVHRPGEEIENLTPTLLHRLLFDDIPYGKKAVEEHDRFTNIMREHGVEVLYIEELVAETLDQRPELRDKFIDKFIDEAKIRKDLKAPFRTFLASMPNFEMVKKMIAGTKKSELGIDHDKAKYPFIADPLPNILYQRDPFASIGDGITMHHMWSITRNRETLFPDFVFTYHPRFANQVPYFYERDWQDSIEGGDILVLNQNTLIIGNSQRTSMEAIKKAAPQIFNDGSYNKIIVLDLPKNRSFMHLDTVFTNIDYDKFVVHPLIFDHIDEFKIYELTPNDFKEVNKPLIEVLKEATKTDVQLIKCGGDDSIDAGREQWNDGTNVITLEPGVVIAYERNHVTIDLLKQAGVEVITMPSSELSRGRGGPRCMTMPIWRDDLKKIS